MLTKQEIEEFFREPEVAVIGISKNDKKFANAVYRELKKKEIKVYGVGMNVNLLDDEPIYSSVKEIVVNIHSAVIIVKPEHSLNAVKDCVDAGIKNIWLQQGAESEEAIKYCADKEVNLIVKQCILMFASPTGFHKLHWWVNKTFKMIPA